MENNQRLHSEKNKETLIFEYKLPNNCPAILLDGNYKEGTYNIYYFRVVKSHPPTRKDFIPQYFLKEQFFRKRKNMLEKSKEYIKLCQMSWLSKLTNKDDSVRLIKKFPSLGQYIYKGIIYNHHGLIIKTPSNEYPEHCSFFIFKGQNSITIFSEHEEV